MRKDAPLAFDVPSADRDNPGWVKVGVIAVFGFVIGVAWPRLMGVRLGPSAPGEAASALAASSASAMPSSANPTPAPAALATTSVASNAAPTEPPQGARVDDTPAVSNVSISLGKTSVLSCKVDGGDTKKGKECGTVAGLDQLVSARLRKLSTCSAAEGQSGKLSVVVTADFSGNKVTWDIGRSSNVGNVDAIGGCLKTLFQGASVSSVAHEHSRYTVAYSAMIAGGSDAKVAGGTGAGNRPKAEAAPENEPVKASTEPSPSIASGSESTVGWEVALVRDTPKVGQIVARLPRGTKVKVGSSRDGWSAIKYGDGFASDGWVYRGALGTASATH